MFYVLRSDGAASVSFKDEKEAYYYICAQCMAFPLVTFLLTELKAEYSAKITGPE